jgi:hypothetical protein
MPARYGRRRAAMNIEIRDEALANRELDNQKIRRGLDQLERGEGITEDQLETI